MSKPTMCNVQHGTWNVQSSTFTLQKINAQCTESLISSQPWGALGLGQHHLHHHHHHLLADKNLFTFLTKVHHPELAEITTLLTYNFSPSNPVVYIPTTVLTAQSKTKSI